jgi:methylated-DNA-[protein]-cysteine S-methyltransferase
VWDELRRIPYGQTISYGELARRVGDVRATRAVAQANGQNFIAVVIPCHRVIGADGTLTGYGGGLERKRWLLEHEARITGKALKNFCWDSPSSGHRGVNAARSRHPAPAEAESLFPA